MSSVSNSFKLTTKDEQQLISAISSSRRPYRDWQSYVCIRRTNVLISCNRCLGKTVHIDSPQCYTSRQSKAESKEEKWLICTQRTGERNSSIRGEVIPSSSITTFILSLSACDEPPMWQSQTYERARHFFLSSFRSFSLSLFPSSALFD